MNTGRDIKPVSTSPTSSPPGRKVIAVIGIDRYRHWQRLGNAVRDATRTAQLFEQLGFEQLTAPLLDDDATGKAIQSLVQTDLKRLGANDSLVVFYAGHGATYGHRPGGEEIKTGYLIPTDAASSPDDVATWIDLEGWLRAVALLPAKHILVILDACRSGIALDGIIQRHRGADAWQHETSAALQARRSRRIITSALGDQVALDAGPKHGQSLFTGCLLEGLTYDLRRHGDQATTGSALGAYLQRRVDTHTKSQQTPDFGSFYHDDRGEIAIPILSADVSPSDTAVEDASALELAPFDASMLAHDRARSPVSAHPVSISPGRNQVDLDLLAALRQPAVKPAGAGTAVAALSQRYPDDPTDLACPPPPPSSPLPAFPSSRDAVAAPRTGAPPETGERRARAIASAGLTPGELSDLVKQLERAIDADLERFTGAIAISLVGFVLVTGVSTTLGSASVVIAASLGGFVVLSLITLRLLAPTRMRSVVRAVRDTPEDVVQLAHHLARSWIEISTADHRITFRVEARSRELFAALIRRCPSAKVAEH